MRSHYSTLKIKILIKKIKISAFKLNFKTKIGKNKKNKESAFKYFRWKIESIVGRDSKKDTPNPKEVLNFFKM